MPRFILRLGVVLGATGGIGGETARRVPPPDGGSSPGGATGSGSSPSPDR
jgi:hypothetical protein